jgi:hypothetical protein
MGWQKRPPERFEKSVIKGGSVATLAKESPDGRKQSHHRSCFPSSVKSFLISSRFLKTGLF